MFFNALAVLVVSVLSQFVFADNQCTRTYTVQPGDICDSISAAQNVSTYQLAVVNDGVIDETCDNLQPGQALCLGWADEDCTTTYVVQAGDDCDGIANAQGINTTMLYDNNPQLDQEWCSNLYIGEVVCVARSIITPPLPASGTMPAATVPPTSTPALPWCD